MSPDLSPEPQTTEQPGRAERNMLPFALAAAVVIIAAGVLIFGPRRNDGRQAVIPVTAPVDPYATNLPVTNLALSESGNLSGGKMTYLDGHIENRGNQTVSGITVQVIFRDAAHEVARNETQALKLIRTRDPYVDVEPVSAAPLAAGAAQDFRLIFDTVPPDWDGAFPEIRVLHVQTR